MKREKLNLLLISQSGGGGLGKYLRSLIENIDYSKFNVWVAVNEDYVDKILLDEFFRLNDKLVLINLKYFEREISPVQDFLTYRKVVKLIKEIKPDIVHCNSSKAGVIGRLAAKRCHVKKVFYTPHWYAFLSPEFSSWKKRLFVFIERIFSRYLTIETFNTSFGEKEAAIMNKLDRPEKFKVIYNGLEEINFPSKFEIRKKLGFLDDTFLFGNIARIVPQKNPKLFVEIAKLVVSIDPSIHFLWIGDGNLRKEISQFINRNKLYNNVHFIGYRKDAEILIAGVDAFLSTSSGESYGYSAAEALRAGIPLLLSDVMGHREMVIDNKNGKLFDSGEILFNIDNVIEFTEYVKKLRFNDLEIKETFRDRFLLSHMIESIEDEYEKS